MSSDTKRNRAVLATKYKSAFSSVIESIQFKKFIKIYGLNMYKFEILSNKHRDEVINLCCLRLASKGNIPSIITSITPQQCKIRFVEEIDYAIKTKLSFVAIHSSTSKVAFVLTQFDIMDAPKKQTETYPIALQKRNEFMAEFVDNDPIFKLLNERKKNNDINYGEIIHDAFMCSNPRFRTINMSTLVTTCTILMLLTLYGVDSVKQRVGTYVHAKTVWLANASKYLLNKLNINITAKTTQYKINNILLKKMNSDPWYKQNIDDAKLNRLIKKNYSISCGGYFFNRDHGVNLMEMYLDLLLSVTSNFMSMSAVRSKNHSKL